jgi:hypothetical protein
MKFSLKFEIKKISLVVFTMPMLTLPVSNDLYNKIYEKKLDNENGKVIYRDLLIGKDDFFASKCLIKTTDKINLISLRQQKMDIHTAVLKNDIKQVKQLILSKADINVKESMGGSTPLISAAVFGRTEIAKLLINAGAKLNIQNNDGSTALTTASFFCRLEIVKILLHKKADKTIKNKYGQTALETIQAPFIDAKPVYDMLGSALSPLGLKLDYAHIEKTRPIIAKILK